MMHIRSSPSTSATAERSGRRSLKAPFSEEMMRELQAGDQVWLSGNLFTARDALQCVQSTGVDTVMFARGALMDPAVGMRYQHLLQGRRDLPSNRDFVLRLCREAIDVYRRYSTTRAVLKLRSLLPRMMRGLPGAKELRKRIILCKEWQDLEEVMTSAQRHPETQ